MITNTTTELSSALQAFSPSHLELINESHMHAHHFEGKESHFKLIIVSNKFENLRLIARHQLIYQQVAQLLTLNGGTVHALAIHAFTPDEWQKNQSSLSSPKCAGQNTK